MLWPTRNAGYRADPMESGCTFATSVDCLGQILPIIHLPKFLNELIQHLMPRMSAEYMPGAKHGCKRSCCVRKSSGVAVEWSTDDNG